VEIRVLATSEDEAADLKETAQNAGASADVIAPTDVEQQELAPAAVLLWVVVAGAVAVVADFVRNRQGRVIDLTKDPVEVRKQEGLPPGTLLVLLANDTYEIKEAPKSALENIFNAAGSAAAKAAVELAGGKKVA
jgi:hypothetical protein